MGLNDKENAITTKILERNSSRKDGRAGCSPWRLKNWDLSPLKLRSRIAFPPGKENPIFPTSSSPGNPESAPKVIYWTVLFVYKVHNALLVFS